MSYSFYIAKIIDTSTINDNRLKVRVLPYMDSAGIKDDECPLYPSFFRDEEYTGKIGEYVWVIANEDFSVGYIFGLANYNTYSDISTIEGNSIFETSADGENLSIPKTLRENISDNFSKEFGRGLSLENTKITYWDDNCIHYIERSTGGKVIAYRNGTFYIFRPDEFIVRIGSTKIKIDSEHFSTSSGNINLQSDYVGLGKKPSQNVLVNDGGSGVSAIKSDSVFA